MKPESAIDKLNQVNEFAWSLFNSNPENETKRNMSTQDLKVLIGNLENQNVQYLLIGGFAMAFHGHVRATNDIDLWIKNTPENMSKLRSALIETGIPEARVLRDTTQLVGGFTVFNLLETDFKIDLFHNLKSFKEADFDRCSKRAKISDYHGLKIPVLSAEDLFLEKKSVAREKDAGDISFLQKLLNKLSPGKNENKNDQGMSM
jgi:predicted nucleotidyltransferase